MPQVVSRKRPAPGALPVTQQSQFPIYSPSTSAEMASTQDTQWNPPSTPLSFSESYPNTPSNYPQLPQNPVPPPQPASNQMTRRAPGQDLAQAQRAPYMDGNTDIWPSVTDNGMQQLGEGGWRNNGDDLDQKAQMAKRDAQAKRKQIPPFVQKLSRQVFPILRTQSSIPNLTPLQFP